MVVTNLEMLGTSLRRLVVSFRISVANPGLLVAGLVIVEFQLLA